VATGGAAVGGGKIGREATAGADVAGGVVGRDATGGATAGGGVGRVATATADVGGAVAGRDATPGADVDGSDGPPGIVGVTGVRTVGAETSAGAGFVSEGASTRTSTVTVAKPTMIAPIP
jgi:hypothetical protein